MVCMIDLKKITKVYSKKGIDIIALKEINLKIENGDIYGVIGYSGAGKSTLVRLINYLERPTKGQVVINGTDLGILSKKELRSKKKGIGMIFQHFNLLESKTIFENVAIPLVLLKTDKSEIRKRVLELLEFVGLEDKVSNYPNELSGGQKQRVGIARALACNPSILLCDEATSALDPQTTESILKLLRKINEQYNITIVIITHEMEVVKQICHKVAVMENGEIIEQGTVLNVFGNPQHQTTKNFVRTIIRTDIPDKIKKIHLTSEKDTRILKLNFVGQSSFESIIYEIINIFEIKVDILFSNTTEIQNNLVGVIIIKFKVDDSKLQEILSFLAKRKIIVEVV